jgi:cytochrome c biogenesis protein CcdA
MEPVALSFTAVLLAGLVFGAGPCNITCLPYLGPVFLAQDSGWRRSIATVLPFSLGRLAGYTLLGTVAGYAGHTATQWLEQGPASWILGGAAVLLGLSVIRRAGNKPSCSSSRAAPAEQTISIKPEKQHPRRTMPLGLFGLGLGMAFNPCVPLGTVLTVAAATANPLLGLELGLAFGIGAVVIPSLLFSVVVAHFGSQVRLHLQRWQLSLERGAGSLLVMMGMLTAIGWVQP